MKNIIICILIVVLAGSIGVIGLVIGMKISTRENRMVIGGMATSPDGKWAADLNAVIMRKGGAHYFYEFSLYGSASEERRLKTNHPFTTYPVKTVHLPVASEDQLIKRRGVPPFPIEWSEDSRTVKTKIDGVEIILYVDDIFSLK